MEKIVIKELHISTNKPIEFIKKLKKLLVKFGNREWDCNFRIENKKGNSHEG